MKPCYNLYKHQLGPFLRQTKDFLHIVKGQDLDYDASIDDTCRWSWTCKQKLGVIKYVLLKVVLNKARKEELILNNAAANNISCTPKMLQD
jgi:hypothetical protein